MKICIYSGGTTYETTEQGSDDKTKTKVNFFDNWIKWNNLNADNESFDYPLITMVG